MTESNGLVKVLAGATAVTGMGLVYKLLTNDQSYMSEMIADAMVKYGGIAMVGTALAAGLQYALRIRDGGK